MPVARLARRGQGAVPLHGGPRALRLLVAQPCPPALPPAPPVCLQARRERVTEPARTELSSRVRYYLFAFLAFVLAGEVIADLQSGAYCAFVSLQSKHRKLNAGGGDLHDLSRRVPCLPRAPADAPSAVQDVIYTLLVVALGVTSLSERRTKL